jgi:hypothetical protein
VSKLVRNLIIGVAIAIIASFFVRGVSKYSAQNAYNSYLQNEQKDYGTVEIQNNTNTLIEKFTYNEPYFTLNLPKDITFEKAMDRNGIVAYRGEIDTIMCQLQIIDIYTLTDLKAKGYERRVHDYNMYTKTSMDAAYDGLVKSTISNSPYGDVVDIEHSVKKINNVIFIYIKYKIPDDDGDMIRKSFNFLINGYNISVVGLYFSDDDNAEIEVDNYLNSIKF